ncbi:MAG: hypothetical protein KF708_18130 [Pirellulales bacterium]|nr:hypothetical protein [Pirellulales bacterium]
MRTSARFPIFAALLLLAGILGVSSAQAAVIIDDFDVVTGVWPVTRTTVGSTVNNELGIPTTNTIGGVRNTTVTGDSFAVPGLDTVTTTVVPTPPSLLDYASSAGADGSLNLLYNAGGIPGGLNANFSAETGITIDFLLFDHAGGVDLPVTVTLSDGSNVASLTQLLTSPGAQSVFFGFPGFAGIGGVDMSSIDSLNFFFDAQLAHDFRIDFIGTTSGVPEPASFLVWGMAAVVGLFVSRRCRKPSAV